MQCVKKFNCGFNYCTPPWLTNLFYKRPPERAFSPRYERKLVLFEKNVSRIFAERFKGREASTPAMSLLARWPKANDRKTAMSTASSATKAPISRHAHFEKIWKNLTQFLVADATRQLSSHVRFAILVTFGRVKRAIVRTYSRHVSML